MRARIEPVSPDHVRLRRLDEVTVRKAYLATDLLEVLDTEPIVQPPWDPMGALARAA